MSRLLTRRSLLGAGFSALASSSLASRALGQQAPQRWAYSITDFANGDSNGWLPGFTDFPPGIGHMDRRAEVRPLPEEVRTRSPYGYYLRGRNTPDDLFMFIKKPVVNLASNSSYRVDFYIEFASSAPSNCVGIGGAPGESVWLKAGATQLEPLALLDDDYVQLSADKGQQSTGGRDAIVVSDIANGIPCEQARGEFVLLTRSGTLPRRVETDLSGSAWIFVGTDSGFEGTTELYYAFIAALFTLEN
jgi:hypothetical protein